MYLCQCCGAKVGPGIARLVHVLTRTVTDPRLVAGRMVDVPRQEIAREVNVCPGCKERLEKQSRKPIRSPIGHKVSW
jgi:uncharacterized protein with PIN domain